MRRLALAAGVLALAACTTQFEHPSTLTKLRILGIQAEPPDVRSGDSFDVTALVYAPEGQEVRLRWRACQLEVPFSQGRSQFGGGGSVNTGQAIPSEQQAPPQSCFDVEGAANPQLAFLNLSPQDGTGETATFSTPFWEQALSAFGGLGALDAAADDVPLDQLPEEFQGLIRGLLSIGDPVNLGALHGVYFNVSLEAKTDDDVLIANKKVPVKTTPELGGGPMSLVDDDGVGPKYIDYQLDEERLTVSARFLGDVPVDGGAQLAVYGPRRTFDPDAPESVGVPSASVTRDGHRAVYLGQGVSWEVRVRWEGDTPSAALAVAADGGAWNDREHAVEVGRNPWQGRPSRPGEESEDGEQIDVHIPLADLGLTLDDPIAFLVTWARGDERDAIPDRGQRYAWGGRLNTNPAAPAVALEPEIGCDNGDTPKGPEEAGQCPPAPVTELSTNTCDAVCITPTVDHGVPRSVYPFVDFRGLLLAREETPFYSWFTTAGRFQGQARTQGDEKNDDTALLFTDELRVAAGAQEERAGEVHVVARDGRGGVSWSKIPLEVEVAASCAATARTCEGAQFVPQ